MSQSSSTPRDRSTEPTPLNRNPAAPSAPAAIPNKPTPAADAPSAPAPRRRSGFSRFVLIVVLPVAAVALGLLWWVGGGRYVSTDNAYVGADKVLITPQVSGAIVAVHVREGQKVAVGDPLFDIDPAPYRTALALARGRLAAAKIEFANLQAAYASNEDQIKMAKQAVDLRQSDYDRKVALVNSLAGTRVDEDTSAAALVQARQILEFVREQQEATKVKLGGGLDATIDTFPDFMQATAQVEDAERNFRNANVLAPIAGVATQVDQIELGRVAPAGQPVFAVVADTGLWVDANPKESDLTYVRDGEPATVTIDAFPGREWRGKCRRSRLAPARNSRSCRRRTRAETGSRSCSAFRCASRSTPTRTSPIFAPA